ncbi:hypothetical protein EVAR_32342_1 [Eumeta japonica]|uniref:Uncharacterized protein n=1 Tax=Eumeta variegata TaxID=151549 RepID=A0A4C1Z813_EUMVA|nr:hypothetical protein EVAR_32342_1 [Eumeta japonica]
MDSKRVTRARKMNTAEQENETSMSAPTSRSSETGTSSARGTTIRPSRRSECSRRIRCNGPLAANMRNRSPAHQLNIDDSNRNMNTARQKKHAALLAQLEFEQLESERIAA